MSKFYIDCEFDGHGGPLLSFAIVGEAGCSLHVRTEVKAASDPWVAENVLPIMGEHQASSEAWDVPLDSVGWILRDWLNLCQDNTPTIIADSPVDIGRFCEAISTARGGGWQSTDYAAMTFEVHNVDCWPNDLPGAVQHNAWWDAMALRYKLTAQGMETGTAETPAAPCEA